MTKEEILAMPAGRELDSLVSELVMGIKTYPDQFDGVKIWDRPYEDRESEIIPHYSTELTWAIVDRMKELGWELRMEGVPLGQMVKFYNHKHDLRDDRPYAANVAPLALCHAALLAVMWEELSHDSKEYVRGRDGELLDVTPIG